MAKFTAISILILMCLICESFAQNGRSSRKKTTTVQKTIGLNHRINQNDNYGLPPQNLKLKPKRPVSDQRKKTKSSVQRQDHG